MVIVKKTLLGLILWICCLANTHAEDIDLFASGLVNGASLGALPNIIFLLDNTSNWSQSLADGTKRGVAEAAAIKATLQGLDTDVNVAVLEFTTETGGGSSDNNGAFVRVALQPYQASASAIHVVLDTMVSDINAPVEKRNSNTEWGNLIYDVYNYLGGFDQSFAGAGTPSAIADSAGYDVNYSNFATPLDVAGLCAETYVIFISNPNSSGPRDDSADNSAALTQLYTDAGMAGAPNVLADGGPIGQQSGGLLMPTYSTGGAQTGLIGRSEGCYQNVAACDGNVNKNNPNPSEVLSHSEQLPVLAPETVQWTVPAMQALLFRQTAMAPCVRMKQWVEARTPPKFRPSVTTSWVPKVAAEALLTRPLKCLRWMGLPIT